VLAGLHEVSAWGRAHLLARPRAVDHLRSTRLQPANPRSIHSASWRGTWLWSIETTSSRP